MLTTSSARGFTLIEMMIAFVILSILLALAAQDYHVWIANSQIRTAAETLVQGLSAARSEAVKRNGLVALRLVTDLSSECEVSSTGTSWVASVTNPTGNCDAAISDTVPPTIIAKKSGAEKTGTVTVSATNTGGNVAAHTVVFGPVGRVVGSLDAGAPIGWINLDSSAITREQSRDLRIAITMGGMIRMCDPDPGIQASDPRKC
jgi:type IV fimbrial biogenesis protein FimT